MDEQGINERFTGEGNEALLMIERSESLRALASYFEQWSKEDVSLRFNGSQFIGRSLQDVEPLDDPAEDVDDEDDEDLEDDEDEVPEGEE